MPVYLNNAYEGFLTADGYKQSSIMHSDFQNTIGPNDSGSTAYGPYSVIASDVLTPNAIDFTTKLLGAVPGEEFVIAEFKNNQKLVGYYNSNGYLGVRYEHGTTIYQFISAKIASGSSHPISNITSALLFFVRTSGGNMDTNIGFYIRTLASDNWNSRIWSVHDNHQPYLIALLTGAIVTDPYETLPSTEPSGGFGGGDYSNDDTDFEILPTLSSSQVGFCTLYKLTQTQMEELADYLWGLSQGTIATFLPLFSNPMECIIAVGIVPVEPQTASADLIKVGNLTTTKYGSRITKQYDEIDMGYIDVGFGDYTNSFMDYSPYTKAELYLPYIGTVSLDTDEIMDSRIAIKYKFDLLSGSCVAEVKVTKRYNYQNADHVHENVLYRYSGNFMANIPINGENFSQMFSAVVGAVAMGINAAGSYKSGMASAEATRNANVANARHDAADLHRIGAAFSGIASTAAMKPNVQRAGNISSVCGFLSKQKPELILKLPKVAAIGANQGHEVGYPRYGEYTVSELEGYTRVMMIHLKNIPCTDTEREIIESDLDNGVIFSKTAIPSHAEFQNYVKVYKFKCENICVNKADDWSLLDTIAVKWLDDEIDVLHPTIRIVPTTNLTKSKILKEGNYVYIPDFDRYYYVKNVKALKGNMLEMELSVDACMSWLTNLRNQQCVVDRQEAEWNTYLNDEYMRVYNTPYTVVKEFPSGFNTSNFILAVAGGGGSSST